MIGLRGLKAKWEPRALKKLNQRERLVRTDTSGAQPRREESSHEHHHWPLLEGR
jgi:hypothetical protein